MRALHLATLSLLFVANLVCAGPTNPVEGTDYQALTKPQAVTATGKKVEVIEFFMYHCPACNLLEPMLLDWVKKQGDNIVFRRMHLPHKGADDPEAHMFLTLEALQLEDKLHAKILTTWHVEHHQLLNDQDNIDWAVKNGIDRKTFVDTYGSFSVVTKLHNLLNIAQNYQVNSTPTLVIDGRYLTSPAVLQPNYPTMSLPELDQVLLQVADALVLKAKAGK